MRNRVSDTMEKLSFQPNSLVSQIMFKTCYKSGTILGTMNIKVTQAYLCEGYSLVQATLTRSNGWREGWMDKWTNGQMLSSDKFYKEK